MKEIDIKKTDRENTYNWFKGFSNSTYSCNVVMDLTNLLIMLRKMIKLFL